MGTNTEKEERDDPASPNLIDNDRSKSGEHGPHLNNLIDVDEHTNRQDEYDDFNKKNERPQAKNNDDETK